MFKYDGKIYKSFENCMQAVMSDFPEVLDDDLPDLFDKLVEDI